MPVQPSASPARPRSAQPARPRSAQPVRSRDFQRLPSTIAPSAVAPGTLYRRSAGSSGASRTGIALSTVLVLALIVFLVQNTGPVQLTFLGMTGTAPLALVVLLAVAAVAVVGLVIGSMRTARLRHLLTADPRAARL